MTAAVDGLHRWIFLLTAGSLFAGAVLRSVLSVTGDPSLTAVVFILLVWLVLFAAETAGAPRWQSLFPLYMAAQTAIIFYLLSAVESGDFYAVLFGILSMQAMRRLGWKMAVLWIVLFTPLTALALALRNSVPQAIAFALIYAAVDALLAFFTLTTLRAEEARTRNQTFLDEILEANHDIEVYSRRIERLAAVAERHRLARDLHDSVTQTVFGMNMTARSATLLLDRDQAAAVAQLERLEELGRCALAEIRAIDSELAPEALGRDGLVAALRAHVAERRVPDGLSVTLSVEGEKVEGGPPEAGPPGALSAKEELALFRIVQEALNNVVKHAGADAAAIRLRLSPPRLLEVEDRGRGFDPHVPGAAGGLGLHGMCERAAEIGWSLRVRSTPGAGTTVVVEEGPSDTEQPKGRLD